MNDHAPAQGTDAATLGLLYEFTYGVFTRNTEGVGHQESLKSPAPAGNCMNWVLGHLLVSRNGILKLLGQAPVGDPSRLERYRRGSQPVTDGSHALSWDELKAAFEASQERLREGLKGVTVDHLASPLPEDANPFQVASTGQMLYVFNFHETYHIGQLGLLRRTVGLDPAIK